MGNGLGNLDTTFGSALVWQSSVRMNELIEEGRFILS